MNSPYKALLLLFFLLPVLLGSATARARSVARPGADRQALYRQSGFTLARGVDIAIATAQIAYQKRHMNVYKRLADTLYSLKKSGGFSQLTNQQEDCAKDGVLAFTLCPGGDTIYVCKRSLTEFTIEDLVMTLLHEAGHVIGYCDECQAEWLAKYTYEYGASRKFVAGYTECFE